jgi:hypothetical protein
MMLSYVLGTHTCLVLSNIVCNTILFSSLLWMNPADRYSNELLSLRNTLTITNKQKYLNVHTYKISLFCQMQIIENLLTRKFVKSLKKQNII